MQISFTFPDVMLDFLDMKERREACATHSYMLYP